jgi:hypothetical protein
MILSIILTLSSANTTNIIQMPSLFNKLSKKMKEKLESDLIRKDDFYAPEGKHDQDRFLDAISQVESSGGVNLNHPIIKEGMHEGTAAVGKHAIMPKTAKNIGKMLKSSKSTLRQYLGKDYKDEQVESLADKDINEIKKDMENSELTNRLARYLAKHVDLRYKGNPEKKAYSWLFGHNIPDSKIDKNLLESSNYVKKFNKHYNK